MTSGTSLQRSDSRTEGCSFQTGGFTREALYEADRTPSGRSITTLNRDEFIDLLTQHYERLEPQAQAMIPLKEDLHSG